MPYSVQFVGLVCFLRDGGGRRVLLPDGRNPGNGADPHYGSIVVDEQSVLDATNWNGDVIEPGVFRLPPCWLSIEGSDVTGTLDVSEHQGRLPELRAIDPNFVIDPDDAATIAQLHIQRGTLRAFAIPGGTAMISQLDVPHDGEIQVTVTPTDGVSPTRTIRLAAGTEIAVTNTAGEDIYAAEAEPHHHFSIYGQLSVNPVTLTAPATTATATTSPSQHRLFMRRTPIGLSYECSNTGCC